MKKLSFLLLCLPVMSICLCAQENEKSRLYDVRSNIPVFPCDLLGRKFFEEGKYEVPPLRSKFALVRSADGDMVVIRFLNWDTKRSKTLHDKFNEPLRFKEIRSPETKKALEPDPDRPANDSARMMANENAIIEKYFLLSRADLDSNCLKIFTTGSKSIVFTIGLVTMPLKLRLGSDFDFQGNLSLGTTAGIKMRLSRYNPNYVNFLFGASIATISLDSFSTKGKVTGQPINNMAVFSPSLGLVFEFGNAQAGLFYGWDFLNKSSQSQYSWIYNKKPWLSIGFGFSIFTVNSKSSTQAAGKQ